MLMLRVCVIGLGPIGNRHAELYREDPLAELVGVCDMDKGRADAAAATHGVPAFYDVQTMLDALRPDVVSVATGGYEYGSDHYLPTMQALEAGCHVLCEKPISNEIAEGRGDGRQGARARASATASTSTTASRPPPGWPRSGWTRAASATCCSST